MIIFPDGRVSYSLEEVADARQDDSLWLSGCPYIDPHVWTVDVVDGVAYTHCMGYREFSEHFSDG